MRYKCNAVTPTLLATHASDQAISFHIQTRHITIPYHIMTIQHLDIDTLYQEYCTSQLYTDAYNTVVFRCCSDVVLLVVVNSLECWTQCRTMPRWDVLPTVRYYPCQEKILMIYWCSTLHYKSNSPHYIYIYIYIYCKHATDAETMAL